TNIYNSALQRSHEREFTGILDREIMANMAAHIVYVYREPMGQTVTINALRPFSSFNIPIQRRDPGPDGIVNTADYGPMVTVWDSDAAYPAPAFVGNEVVNRPDDKSNHFYNFEFPLARRASARWSAQTSFLTTKNYVYNGAGTTASPSAAYPQSPNDLTFPID